MSSFKKSIVFDFDGVIHSYSSGWKGVDIIPDPPVSGIDYILKSLYDQNYQIYIVSSRCKSVKGKIAIREYLIKHDLYKYIHEIRIDKPPAICYIDDRAITFNGEDNPDDLLTKIYNFKSWCE